MGNAEGGTLTSGKTRKRSLPQHYRLSVDQVLSQALFFLLDILRPVGLGGVYGQEYSIYVTLCHRIALRGGRIGTN